MDTIHHEGIIDGQVLTIDDGHLVGASAIGVPGHRHDTTLHTQLIHELIIVLDRGIVFFLTLVDASDGAPDNTIFAINHRDAFIYELGLQQVCQTSHLFFFAPVGVVF